MLFVLVLHTVLWENVKTEEDMEEVVHFLKTLVGNHTIWTSDA